MTDSTVETDYHAHSCSCGCGAPILIWREKLVCVDKGGAMFGTTWNTGDDVTLELGGSPCMTLIPLQPFALAWMLV